MSTRPWHPAVEDLRLDEVLRVLGDPTRLALVAILAAKGPTSCGALATQLEIPLSTLSNHLRQLRESGVTWSRRMGTSRLSSLRDNDLEVRFPGLLRAVVAAERAATSTSLPVGAAVR
ncbi:MAG: ArsR/SmtB family transcription factor [Phycicoccus sp.]